MSAATPKSRADAFALQNNIRHQSEDQMAALQALSGWEAEMKKRDKEIKKARASGGRGKTR